MKSIRIILRGAVLFLCLGSYFVSAQESDMTVEELRALRDQLKAKNEALKAEVEVEEVNEASTKEDVDLEKNIAEEETVEENEQSDISINEIASDSIDGRADVKETLIIQKEGYTKKTVIIDNDENSEITTITITEKDDDQKEDLEEEVEDLKDKLDDAKDELDDLKEDLEEQLEESKEEAAEIKEDLDEAIEEASNRSRAAFAFMPEVKWLDIDPLSDLAKKDNSLKNKIFDFSSDVMPYVNFLGYADIDGKGLRVGQIISGGYKSYVSDEYTGISIDSLSGDTTAADSVIRLHVIPVSLGFVFEKAFTVKAVSFHTGFMLGGGALMVVRDIRPADPETDFYDSDSYKDESDDGTSFIIAPSVNWDLHFGSTVKMTKNFSLGIEGVFDFTYGFYGFGTGYKDYVTWSPGIRLRLGFGKGC